MGRIDKLAAFNAISGSYSAELRTAFEMVQEDENHLPSLLGLPLSPVSQLHAWKSEANCQVGSIAQEYLTAVAH